MVFGSNLCEHAIATTNKLCGSKRRLITSTSEISSNNYSKTVQLTKFRTRDLLCVCVLCVMSRSHGVLDQTQIAPPKCGYTRVLSHHHKQHLATTTLSNYVYHIKYLSKNDF